MGTVEIPECVSGAAAGFPQIGEMIFHVELLLSV